MPGMTAEVGRTMLNKLESVLEENTRFNWLEQFSSVLRCKEGTILDDRGAVLLHKTWNIALSLPYFH